MVKEICTVLKTRLLGLPFIGTIAGVAQPVLQKRFAADTNVKYAKKMPVAYDVQEAKPIDTVKKINIVGLERQLIPNQAVKSVLYFEDNGAVLDSAAASNSLSFIANIRLVCWLNKKKLANDSRYAELTAICSSMIIKRLTPGRSINVQGLTKVFVKNIKMAPQDNNIFAKYNYDEDECQYLRPPFEYFALDLSVSYTLRTNCLPTIDWLDACNCPTPTNVSVIITGKPGHNNFTFSWDYIPEATNGYRVQITESGVLPVPEKYVIVLQPDPETLRVSFTTNDYADGAYDFYIFAICGPISSQCISPTFVLHFNAL